jgi:prolyl-tRNA synthetase
VVEQHHDEHGIVWPAALAPYDVQVIPLGRKVDVAMVQAVTDALTETGLDVLVDDRPDRSAGVRFADADLIGCPVRVVIGRRAAEGVVEVRSRDGSVVTEVPIADLVATVAHLRQRSGLDDQCTTPVPGYGA